MNIKELMKQYDLLCQNCNRSANEENKQQYLILFKELELSLNKEFHETMENMSYTAKNIKEEINKTDKIIKEIEKRQNRRNKMSADHKKIMGYEPLNLKVIDEFDLISDYISYREDLISANKIILELIKTGKKLKSMEEKLTKNPNNVEELNTLIKVLKLERNNLVLKLKNNKDVLEDLYNFSLTAPYNEENAYINFLLIKIKKDDSIKINISKENKRILRSDSKKKIEMIKDELPKLQVYGSVKPNGYISNLEKVMMEYDDITLPTNGLAENRNNIKIDINEI